MKRKILTFLVAALLVIACGTTAFAEKLEPGKTGAISVTLTEQQNKEPIVGAELSVYYVATVCMDGNGNLCYVYTDAFENGGIDIQDPSLATKLDVFVSENQIPAVKITTDETGTATCSDLALGLYFVRQTGEVEGFAPCAPFVVTVPVKNTDGLVYHVNASPKTEAAKLTAITIKKVWNTDASTAVADQVTVRLMKNETVVETAVLNAENNWQVTYTDMPESDAYRVEEVDVPKGFTATYQQNGYVFTVTNTAALIQTGQLVWPIPVLAMGGVVFIAVGILLLQKKRKQNG